MKTEIRISYHNGPWRYHAVSARCWELLQKYLTSHPEYDTVAEVSPYQPSR